MPKGSSHKIVLNSFRFIYDLIPCVVNELPPDSIEGFEELLSELGRQDLYQAVLTGKHRIIVTQKILDEYLDEAQTYNVPTYAIDTTLLFLDDQHILVRPTKLSPRKKPCPGVVKTHRAFIEDAYRAGAHYLLTDRELWLNAAESIFDCYGLRVMTPSQFIRFTTP